MGMKEASEIEAMRERAYRSGLRAHDTGDAEGRAYAEGAEAALLWVLGHIPQRDLTDRMKSAPTGALLNELLNEQS